MSKTRLRKLLSFAVCSLLFCIAACLSAGAEEYLPPKEDFVTIALNETVTLTSDTDNAVGYFKFIPEKSGTYAFSAYGDNCNDAYGFIYDSDMKLLVSSYGSIYNGCFSARCHMIAGETYYLKCRPWSDHFYTSYSVMVATPVKAEKLVLTNYAPSADIYEGAYYEPHTVFSPSHAISESITWTSSNEAVAKVILNYKIAYIGAGTATITGTSESGLSVNFDVTVKSYPVLSETQPWNVSIIENKEQFAKFIPEESGIYRFYATNLLGCDGNVRIRVKPLGYIIDSGDFELTKGQEYTIETNYSAYTSPGTGSYTVNVVKLIQPESIQIKEGTEVSGYKNETKKLSVVFLPELSSSKLQWSSDNEKVATVDENGNITLISCGSAVITATTENGLTSSCNVTVKEFDTLTLNTETKANVDPDNNILYFSFTPEEDGWYEFSRAFDEYHFSYIYVLNENMSVKADGSYEDSVKCNLIGGTTYIFKIDGNDVNTSKSLTVLVKKAVIATSIEVTSMPNQMDYIRVPGYVFHFSYIGMSLDITYSDGTKKTVKLDYEFSTNVDGSEVYFGTSTTLKDGIVKITYQGCETSIKVNILNKTVDHLEIAVPTSVTYMEEQGGNLTNWFNPETQEIEKHFYYSTKKHDDAQIKVVFDDNSFEIVKIGDKLYGQSIRWYDNQSEHPWKVGNDNASTIKWYSYTVTLPITVRENTVASIELVSGDPIIYYENTNGLLKKRFDEASNKEVEYYEYSVAYNALENAVFNIVYDDGTFVTVKYTDYSYDGFYFSVTNKQSEKPWVIGDNNCLFITYLGVLGEYPVSILENPVESLELLTPPTRTEYIYGDVDYWWYDSLEASDLDGLSFAVHYKDGTSKTFTYDDYISGNLDAGGTFIPGVGFADTEPGELTARITYMGFTMQYTITLVESPVEKIEVLDADKIQEKEHFHLDCVGMKIKITYKDGTEKIVTLEEKDLSYSLHMAEGIKTYANIFGHTMSIGYEYGYPGLRLVYLGADFVFEPQRVKTPKIESVELNNVTKKGDGTEITINYVDGTKDVLNYDLLWYKTMEEIAPGVGAPGVGQSVGRTENGLLNMSIYFNPEDEEDMNYKVRFDFWNEYIDVVGVKETSGGDVDENGTIDSDDAIYLLYNVLFGQESYPISGDCDYNCDETVDSDDAIYLLYNVLFGEENYPLYAKTEL